MKLLLHFDVIKLIVILAIVYMISMSVNCFSAFLATKAISPKEIGENCGAKSERPILKNNA